MRILVLAVATGALLVPTGPATGLMKCPQPDGTVISVPESLGCSTEFERAQQRAEQAAEAERRQSQRAGDAAARAAEAQRQQGTDFVQASADCTAQANRAKRYTNDPKFQAAANADGSLRMLGTAQDRFNFESCMEQRGHRLESK